MSQQLVLNIHLDTASTFDNFIVGDNHDLILFLKQLAVGVSPAYAYLWGSTGSGRSHLLQACCYLAESLHLSSVVIDLGSGVGLEPSLLENLECLDLICLDNIEVMLGNIAWEEGLFHLYNRLFNDVPVGSSKLLIVGNQPPAHLECGLSDLKSRLTHGIIYKVESLTDEDRRRAVRQKVQESGLSVTEEVIDYLFSHCSRSLSDLLMLLKRLDTASLVAKRKLTIPFIKSVLEDC